MAQSGAFKALAVVAAVLTISSATMAQELAPAPSPDQGAAYSLPVSGAIMCSSLMVSLLAFMKH